MIVLCVISGLGGCSCEERILGLGKIDSWGVVICDAGIHGVGICK